jgi:carbonic anhydrase/acetyltransferase-like protein (isoleucine patch superfamily)
MTTQRFNILPYLDATPVLQRPPRFAAPGHAMIGRITCGADLWLGAGAVIRADGHFVRVGNDLQMGRGATVHIAHDVYPTLIGDHVTIGANAVVHACDVGSGCVIEDDCVVLDGCELEPAILLEAGSVVFPRSQLQAGWLYSGRPAKQVRRLDVGELEARRALLRSCNEADDDSWATAADMSHVDAGAFIANTAVVHGRVAVADGASVWYGCRLDAGPLALRGEIVIGLRSNVQDNSVLTCGAAERIVIGVDSTIGHNVTLAACTIGNRCLVGIGSKLAAGTVVLDDVFIAAGATTTPGQVLDSGFLWGGQPARQLAPLDERKRALVSGTIATYCDYANELKRQQARSLAAQLA